LTVALEPEPELEPLVPLVPLVPLELLLDELLLDELLVLLDVVEVELWLASSVASWRAAEATVALAEFTLATSELVLSRARTCPTLTCAPSATEIEATCPETGKLTLAWFTGWIVPVLTMACETFVRTTAAVR
jgi:hypothetical protein